MIADNLPGRDALHHVGLFAHVVAAGTILSQAEQMSQMKAQRESGVNLSQYVLEPLRVDEEFILYRAEHSSERGLPSVLVLAPASKHPSLTTLEKIGQQYT
jgi:hypothetical protein